MWLPFGLCPSVFGQSNARETIITLTANGFVSIPDSHFFLSFNDDPAVGHTAPVSAAIPRDIPRSKARPDFTPDLKGDNENSDG